jgi:hypothetical protein
VLIQELPRSFWSISTALISQGHAAKACEMSRDEIAISAESSIFEPLNFLNVVSRETGSAELPKVMVVRIVIDSDNKGNILDLSK